MHYISFNDALSFCELYLLQPIFMNKSSVIAILYFLVACNNNNNSASQLDESITNDNNPSPVLLNYTIVKVYPHDTTSYTEGLLWFNNTLFESTGEYGTSKLAKINLETGKPIQEIKIKDPSIFGEGITIVNNKIYQLTMDSHKVFVYDLNTFKKIQEFEWPYDGWAITHDGKDLIVSTGSSNLYYVNPDNFAIKKIVGVTNNYGPVASINELEYINGYIYSNVFLTDDILKINPATGRVEAKLDMTGLLSKSGMFYNPAKYGNNTNNVLNGIAFDSSKNSLYITGKNWPALFEIKLN